MDLTFDEAEVAFRDEFRAWLAKHVPALGPEPIGEAESYSRRITFQRAARRRRVGGGALAGGVRWS